MARERTLRRVGGFAVSCAIHAAMLAALVWKWAVTPYGAATPSSPRQIEVVAVAATVAGGPPGLRPLDPATDDEIAIPSHPGTLSIQKLTFNFQHVADRARWLFPVLTPGLALEQFSSLPPDVARRRLQFSFAVPPSGAAGQSADRPLAIDVQQRQALIDGAWSRRQRWKAFQTIATIVRDHGTSADLPALLQMYREQDGLQIYVDPDVRDHRLWATLEIAADHRDFIEFIRNYVVAHPSSKASTELLLLLDEIVQSDLSAVVNLLSIEPVRDLQATRRRDSAAYDFVVEIQQYYRRQLTEQRLLSAAAVEGHYDAIRLAILDLALRSTPDDYRAVMPGT
jgi:hypothetical protein